MRSGGQGSRDVTLYITPNGRRRKAKEVPSTSSSSSQPAALDQKKNTHTHISIFHTRKTPRAHGMACLIVALAQSTHTIDKQNRKEKKYFIQLLPSPLLPILAAAEPPPLLLSRASELLINSAAIAIVGGREGWWVGGSLEAEH